MFGDIPPESIQGKVRMILENNPKMDVEEVYRECLYFYGIQDIIFHPEWDKVWKLICDARVIDKRVSDFKAGRRT